ncbi:hypothetical protein [uncultured Vagococcus sp.]|uniref:hypothetical protein n=1 Tax=uncultured Vagococcus sp. TaxID=189676 RepID=UPI0028D3C18F|nr:hypothetical protein [uncultured Vagococcus sp.]
MLTKGLLIILNVLIGIGALAGGVLALSPDARLGVGISESMLVNSPFSTFLFPGLFLIIIIGLGNLLTAWSSFTNQAEAAYYQCLMGLIQCLWIISQCIMLLTITPLHFIFFIFGIVQLIGGVRLSKHLRARFPFSAYQH